MSRCPQARKAEAAKELAAKQAREKENAIAAMASKATNEVSYLPTYLLTYLRRWLEGDQRGHSRAASTRRLGVACCCGCVA